MHYVVHFVSQVSVCRTIISRFPGHSDVICEVGGGGCHGDRQEMTVGPKPVSPAGKWVQKECPDTPTETALIATVAVKYLKVNKH